MNEAIPAILVLGKDNALRRVLTDAFEMEGLEARAFDPAMDELPRGDPRAVVFPDRQRDGVTAGQIHDWRKRWPAARFIELSFYADPAQKTSSDVILQAPRLEELIASVSREVEA